VALKVVAEPERPAAPEPHLTARRRLHPPWEKAIPRFLVGVPVLFNLWVLRSERLVVAYPNDSQTHLQMVQWATSMLSHGLLPFDHWYPHLSLGSPFFVQYQSASAVLAGALGLIVGAQSSYAWTLYLLLALWPLCVFCTGRLLGWGRWESSVAAVISPLLFSITGRGFEDQAFTWLGSGLWSELWAMWTLPLAIGFSWRFISRRQYLFGAVLFSAATIGFHFLMAYLIALILVVLVFLRPSDLVNRLGRCAIVGGCSVLASLWVTLPLISDAKWTAYNEFQRGTTIDNSYGAGRILDWLVTGRIYDYSRLPIVTLLVAVGIVACIVKFRVDERARLLLVAWTLSLLLYFGRPTMSFAIDLLPGNKDLLFQRYIAGVHLAGLFLAGAGTVWLVQLCGATLRRARPAARERLVRQWWFGLAGGALAVVVLLAALAPAWSQVSTYNASNDLWIRYQQAADSIQGAELDTLLSLAAQRGGGRVYAGMPSNWGYDFRVGGVQVYIYMENSPVDAVGFTLRTFSLMTNPEAWFDEDNPGDYGVFGIRYLLLPTGKRPIVPATLLTTSGPYALWTVNSPGLVQVVDTTSSITADASDLGATTRAFLESDLPGRAIYPTIAFAGQPAATPTLTAGETVTGPAGRVLSIHNDLTYGRVTARVFANREAVVLLKSSFDPGWTATVNGVQVAPEMVAPALVGVTVAAGPSRVVFQYHGYGSYPLLFAIAILTLLGVGLGPVLWRRRSRAADAKAKAGEPEVD
jgi:hypothetical protein